MTSVFLCSADVSNTSMDLIVDVVPQKELLSLHALGNIEVLISAADWALVCATYEARPICHSKKVFWDFPGSFAITSVDNIPNVKPILKRSFPMLSKLHCA